jgi:hypothetical protein
VTDVDQLLLSALGRLTDEVGDMREGLARVDQRLAHVEARLPTAQLVVAQPPEPESAPSKRSGKGWAVTIGSVVGAAIAGAIAGMVK